uniref:Integrase n=1 Tax=Dulem virus 39 TaxID=3145757 RepID=A0AAU8B6J4_9CAUD
MNKKNVAYLRVSTEAQTEKYGLEVQKQKILEYCEKKGVEINKWYIDGGYSGSKLDRPEIQELLDDAKKGMIGIVYIYKLDRMSRDVIDTLNLIYRVLPQYNVKVISMTEEIRTENPMDKVMLTMNAAMNQYEREVIRMRMSAGMVERVKKGLWMGGGRIPFGYYYDRNDGILHVNEEQAEKVRTAYRLYIDGYSCDKISRILGFKGERIVSQILKRKSNIGMIEYKGIEYKGLHEPIVDEETFYNAQECMKKRSTNSHVSNNHILTGLCWCGVCGARMRYHKWNGNHRLVCYSRIKGKPYMCKDENCTNKIVMAKTVEDEVEECFGNFVITLDKPKEYQNKTGEIESAIKKMNTKIKNLYELYAESPNKNLLEVIREEEKKLKVLNERLESEKKTEMHMDADKVDTIKKISDAWDVIDAKNKNKILKECIEKIVITGDDIEIHFIDL